MGIYDEGIYDHYWNPKKPPFSRPWMQNTCAAAATSSLGVKSLLAGGIVGGIESLFSYPLEFSKTQLQLDEKTGGAKQYNGLIDVLRKTVQEKGFFGLYRGLGVILFFSVPKIAIRFSSFEMLKSHAADDSGQLSPIMRVLCGLGAGVSEAIFAVTPMETVKVKFIHDQKKKVPEYKGFFSGIRKITQQSGFSGIYQGVMPTILRQGTNQAIRFYVMETLKFNYRKGDPTVVIPMLVIGGFGVIAASASVIGNTPIDVVKTRMQGLEAHKYKNSFDCAKQVWQNEGIKGFYKGCQTRLVRVCVDVGFSFMMYEKLMEIISSFWH